MDELLTEIEFYPRIEYQFGKRFGQQARRKDILTLGHCICGLYCIATVWLARVDLQEMERGRLLIPRRRMELYISSREPAIRLLHQEIIIAQLITSRDTLFNVLYTCIVYS